MKTNGQARQIYQQWLKSTGRTGSVLTGISIKEFFNVLDGSGDKQENISEEEFVKKLSRRYPAAFQMAPKYLWEWIFRNLIKNNL